MREGRRATAAELGAQACPAERDTLSSHEVAFRAAVAQAFGNKRFTLRDLWRERPGSHAWPALWEFFPTPRPDPRWEDQMRRKLERLQGIEPAPGPRGGEGWRVAPTVVQQLVHALENAAASRTARNASQRAAAATLSSRFAAVTLDAAAQQVRAAYPQLDLAPRRKWDVQGVILEAATVGTVIQDWFRAHRYAGMTVHSDSGVITCDWQHAAKLARVLSRLDDVVARRVEVAARHHEGRLAALAPYRSVSSAAASEP